MGAIFPVSAMNKMVMNIILLMSTGVIAAGVVIVYTNKHAHAHTHAHAHCYRHSSLQLGLVRYFKFASGYSLTSSHKWGPLLLCLH
jgi:hypothetical protein